MANEKEQYEVQIQQHHEELDSAQEKYEDRIKALEQELKQKTLDSENIVEENRSLKEENQRIKTEYEDKIKYASKEKESTQTLAKDMMSVNEQLLKSLKKSKHHLKSKFYVKIIDRIS